jgi:predicted transcriptional regulator
VTDSGDNRVPPPLHELETRVMEEIWRRDEATVRQVMEALNANADRALAYTTYMTTLNRLYRKGLLARRREGKGDVYTARWSRDAYNEARARAQVAALVDEFGETALIHFSRQMAKLDSHQLRRLRRLARDG